MLIIFSGLPGTGKTTIAKALVRRLEWAVYIRVDTIEHALQQSGFAPDQIGGTGYEVAYALAAENLRLGQWVVADTVNPWLLTRAAWRAVAESLNLPLLQVEIVCSDPEEHRRRVESRVADLEGFVLPDWQAVMGRDYHPWEGEHFIIDTAKESVEEAVQRIWNAADLLGWVWSSPDEEE